MKGNQQQIAQLHMQGLQQKKNGAK